MKELYAHILLDRSGSMEAIRDRTIEAFNEYVGNLASDPDLDAAISLSLFDGFGPQNAIALDLVHDGVKAKDMPKLSRDTYEPRGNTPLNDAIGKTVARMDTEWHRPGEGIALVILTDGHENSSREYSTTAIRELLEGRRKDKNWLVVYLGANQDAFAEAAVRGMAAANTMNFDAANVKAVMRSTARSHASYAATGNAADMSVGFTDAERHAAMHGDDKEEAKKKRAAP